MSTDRGSLSSSKRKRDGEEDGSQQDGQKGVSIGPSEKKASDDSTDMFATSSEAPKRERKRRRWDTADSTPAAPAATSAPAAAGDASKKTAEDVAAAFDKAKAAEQIRQQIAARLAALGLPTSVPVVPQPTISVNAAQLAERLKAQQETKKFVPILDKDGNMLDEKGNIIQMRKENLATFKVNIREEEQKLKKELAKLKAEVVKAAPELPAAPAQKPEPDASTQIMRAKHYDPRMGQPGIHERKQRGFLLARPGKYIRAAEKMRDEQVAREILAKTSEAEDKAAVTSRLAPLVPQNVPDVEWWDSKILVSDSYDAALAMDKFNHLVHHPVPLPPVGEKPPPPPKPAPLTPAEAKKQKKMLKQQKMKDEQELIQMGLKPPPPPRVTLKNFMAVFGAEAIAEPSLAESKARAQQDERARKHAEHNAARALTPDARREKLRRKLAEDTSVEVHVAVFRVNDLSDPSHRFKVEVNARQYNLTGCAILWKDCNVVVVEGGPKGLKKYTALMTRRINWAAAGNKEEEEEEMDSDEEDNEKSTKAKSKLCVQVWKGVVAKRSFKAFWIEPARTEGNARKYFADKGLAHYWDMARNYKEAEASV